MKQQQSFIKQNSIFRGGRRKEGERKQKKGEREREKSEKWLKKEIQVGKGKRQRERIKEREVGRQRNSSITENKHCPTQSSFAST